MEHHSPGDPWLNHLKMDRADHEMEGLKHLLVDPLSDQEALCRGDLSGALLESHLSAHPNCD